MGDDNLNFSDLRLSATFTEPFSKFRSLFPPSHPPFLDSFWEVSFFNSHLKWSPLPSLDNLRIKLGFPNQDKIPDSIWAFSWYSHSLSPNDPPQLWWWIVKSRFTLNIKDWAPRCLMMRGSRGGKTEIVFTKQSRAENLIIMEDVLRHSVMTMLLV